MEVDEFRTMSRRLTLYGWVYCKASVCRWCWLLIWVPSYRTVSFQAGVSLVWQLLNSPSLRWPGGNTEHSHQSLMFLISQAQVLPSTRQRLASGWLQVPGGRRKGAGLVSLWFKVSAAEIHTQLLDRPSQTSLPNSTQAEQVHLPKKNYFFLPRTSWRVTFF